VYAFSVARRPDRQLVHQIVTGALYSPDRSKWLAKDSGDELME